MKNIFTLLLLTLSPFYLLGQFTPLIFNFDTTESVYIDTSLANNIWQIGNPQKPYFNGALSLPNAILTDTINSYTNNNISEFIVKTPTYIGGWGGVHMRFYHKYDTDTLTDEETVLVSNDGINWVNILYSSAFTSFPWNYYGLNDSILSLNDIGFSGNSNGWQQTIAYWNYPPSDTLWIKFRFASDNIQSNKDGWMIDSLIFLYDLGIGIEENDKDISYQFFPNPMTVEAILSFRQTDAEASVFIYSNTGQLIKIVDRIRNGQAIVDRNNLIPGIYSFLIKQTQRPTESGIFIVE